MKRLNGKIAFWGFLKFLYFSRKIKTLRVMLLGVKHSFQKKGAKVLLYLETFKRAVERGYREGRMLLDSGGQSFDAAGNLGGGREAP